MRLIFKDKNFNYRNSFRIQRTEVIWISRSFYTKSGYSSSIPIVSFLKKASEICNQRNGSQDRKLLSQPVDNKVVAEFNLMGHFVVQLAGRALSSDWSANTFTMVVYKNIVKVQLGFSVQCTTKN